MKQKRKIIEVIILAIFLAALAGFCSKSEEMAKAELYENGVYQQESRNLYFFEEETERVSYQLDYNFYNDFSGVADLIITKVRELEDGEVYELKIESDVILEEDEYAYDRFHLGYFYVTPDRIYRLENEGEATTGTEKQLTNVGTIVCAMWECPDNPEKRGWHEYFTLEDGKCEFHSYNNLVETGFYESFIWEEGKGLVEYLGSAVEYHDAEPETPEEKQAAEDYDSFVKEQYLGTSIHLTEENIEYFAAPCELEYYYEDYSDLFFLYRQPATMSINPPFTCADISLKDMEDSISVIRDGDNTVVVCVKGIFFRIEKAKVYLEAVSNYFCSNIPELDTYSEYISRESEGNAQLTVQVFDDEDGYMVYVGEQWADHSVNWDWFFVRADLSEVYYYDLMDDEYWTIEEWRASERYRDLE